MSDGFGSMGPNPRKEQPKHPDFKGQVTIEGVEYWLSGWNKSNERGEYVSLALEKKKDQRAVSKPGYSAPASARMGMQTSIDDDAPF